MKCRIERMDYFSKYAGTKVFGLTPLEHLERKLRDIGYEIDESSHTVFHDDMFYLDVFILQKGAAVSRDMHHEIHTGHQFHNARLSVKREINTELINKGVDILNIHDTYIDATVHIEPGTVIQPNSHIRGNTTIGADCVIGPDTMIENCTIGDHCEVIKSVTKDSILGNNCSVGPFAHIRPGNNIGNSVKVGAYAEVKNSVIHDKTNLSHLVYVGDSDIGRNCNMSCGVITANYDGRTKSRTVVKDNAFIGCNSTLIAPVTIEKDAYVAAGSTITDDVGEGDLAIARQRQVIKEKWVIEKGRKRSEKP
ncbi:MAG TPA: DapH/DapD/GlmU-related protein [Clostridia bacterium]|nr:DapH/DapD/GlmU-related protein [Clostridia bacterium]HPQ46566.1 DapH/DapD/GlmU-related protein [Clostridia bacterium]